MKITEIPNPLTVTTEMEPPSMSSVSTLSQAPSLSTSVQKHIGNLLKVSYQDLLTQPVPDRFASLLEQLEQAEKKGK